MIENLIIGLVVILICMIIQCSFIILFLRRYIMLKKKTHFNITLTVSTLFLFYGTLVVLLGNMIQIGIWALLFYVIEQFETYSEAFYHATVNFTTLGYGDIIMSDDWKLLGALEAVNGVIMFGLSTGFLFTILSFSLGNIVHKKLEN